MGLRLIFAAAALAASAGACTIFYGTVHVGPDFRVRVQDQGRPVKGLRLKIAGQEAVTDRDGFASLRNVGPGTYFAGVDHDDGIADGVYLNVSAHGPAGVIVPLKWPVHPPVPVRSLQGTLRLFGLFPGSPQDENEIGLLQGLSGRLLKTTRSTARGEFQFANVAPGLYFLRVGTSGLIAVAVDPGAEAGHLDIEIGFSSCGMWYTDRSRCRHRDITVEQLCSVIRDISGGPIPNAQIRLFDVRGTPISSGQTRSDDGGRFSLPDISPGSYRLLTASLGFTTFDTMVHVEPGGGRTCGRPLEIRLGVGSTCSNATIP